MSATDYRRILVKLSGEFLFEFSGQVEVSVHLLAIIKQIKALKQKGLEVVLVLGGGNLCRGRSMQKSGVSRLVADNVGMLSTVINGLVLRDYMRQLGVDASVHSAFALGSMARQFETDEALKALSQGETVICVGGTGNPLCSTDLAASMRAIQLDVDIIVKLSNVKGVYDKDPKLHDDAKFLPQLTYQEAIDKHLNVMDLEAFRQCSLFKIPVLVADCRQANVLTGLIQGEHHGTLVSEQMGE